MSSRWMVVSCDREELADLAHPEIHVFDSVYDDPTPGEVADAVARLLGPPRRQPGDWLRESDVVLIPLDGMRELGRMRGSLSYKPVRVASAPDTRPNSGKEANY